MIYWGAPLLWIAGICNFVRFNVWRLFAIYYINKTVIFSPSYLIFSIAFFTEIWAYINFIQFEIRITKFPFSIFLHSLFIGFLFFSQILYNIHNSCLFRYRLFFFLQILASNFCLIKLSYVVWIYFWTITCNFRVLLDKVQVHFEVWNIWRRYRHATHHHQGVFKGSRKKVLLFLWPEHRRHRNFSWLFSQQ